MQTYLFPNGNVATFDRNGAQIPELQGVYSLQLLEKIKQHADEYTVWNGFTGPIDKKYGISGSYKFYSK